MKGIRATNASDDIEIFGYERNIRNELKRINKKFLMLLFKKLIFLKFIN